MVVAVGAGEHGAGAGYASAVDVEPGEEVFFHGHPSWLSLLGFHLRGLIIALLAGVIAGVATRIAAHHVELGWVIVAVLVVFAARIGLAQLARLQTTYAITDRRLIIERGLVSRELHQTRLDRIQNVNARQSLGQRMLGIGTVDFDTAAETGYAFSFAGVGDPRGLVRTVDRAQHALSVDPTTRGWPTAGV